MEKPAILGGKKAISLDHSILKTPPSGLEIEAVLNNLQQGNITLNSISQVAKSLERKFRSYHAARFAIPFNSCTSALFSAHFASEFHPGDEVLVPAYGYPAGVLSLVYSGATPVFCDVEKTSLSLDPKKAESLITDQTKGLVVMNMCGIPGNLEQLRHLANKHNLIMIEDSARGIGGELSGKKVGTFGDMACFSFSTSKAISTGEGGMLITSSKELYSRALSLGHPGLRDTLHLKYNFFRDTALGTKHRIHPLSACMADVAFDSLDERVEQCNENNRRFNEMLSSFEFIDVLDGASHAKRGGWSGLSFFYIPSKLNLDIEVFTAALQAEGCRLRREYESNILPYSDAITNTSLLIGRNFYVKPSNNFPITDRIRNNLLVLDDFCSYSVPANQFITEYKHALHKIAQNVQKIKREVKI